MLERNDRAIGTTTPKASKLEMYWCYDRHGFSQELTSILKCLREATGIVEGQSHIAVDIVLATIEGIRIHI